MAVNPFESIPEVPMRIIYDMIPLREWIQTDSVSRSWQRHVVDARLTTEIKFCSVELTKNHIKYLHGYTSHYVERLLRRMVHPATGATRLQYLDLGEVKNKAIAISRVLSLEKM